MGQMENKLESGPFMSSFFPIYTKRDRVNGFKNGPLFGRSRYMFTRGRTFPRERRVQDEGLVASAPRGVLHP